MSPLRGVGGRLAYALLFVVACALAIVYLIVVPSFRSSLVGAKLSSLQSTVVRMARVLPLEPLDSVSQGDFASEWSAEADVRVVVYSALQLQSPCELAVVADSRTIGNSSDVQNDPVALAATCRDTLVRQTVSRGEQQYAEVALPVAVPGGTSTILLIASLRDQLQTISVVQRRVLIAGGLAVLFAVLLGYAGASVFARRIRRLEEAAELIAEGNFERPVVDAGSDEVGQLARAFERMRLRLQNLDRARGAFIANASHELRTPLFSLAGFLELLDDPELDADTREEFLTQMREQVVRLTKLATDLLDLSRLDAGRMTVAPEPVELDELADVLSAEFGPRATAAGHELAVAAEAVTARADPERVLQIGRVLVENALVHTPAGTTVRIETAREGGRATLTVADDGPGIPEEARQQVFQRFYRLEGRRASGSGLGLAIARELAEVMGGRIELAERDGWTRFTLVLTAQASDREPEPGLV